MSRLSLLHVGHVTQNVVHNKVTIGLLSQQKSLHKLSDTFHTSSRILHNRPQNSDQDGAIHGALRVNVDHGHFSLLIAGRTSRLRSHPIEDGSVAIQNISIATVEL